MSAPSSMLECALELARRGWPVFPCSPPYDSSPQRGKRPLCPHGFKDATTDEAALRTWWTRWPDANVGLATGSPSGLIVVDVDPRNGGLESLASLPEWKAHIEQTLCVRTGGGGFHAYFSCEKGATLKLPAKLAAGIDLKSEGGYVIAPGSIHPSGKPYQWGFQANEPIGTQEILALPFELLEPAPPPPPARSLRPVDASSAPNAVARYNAEHPQDWPARPGTCPICNHNGCFKALKGSTDRWICYSTNHPDDAGQRNGNGQAWGDALDIDAYNRGFRGQRGRTEYLRSLGFLESACEKEPRFDSQDPVPDEVLSALAPSRDDDQSFVCDNPNVATAATIEPPQFDEPPDDVLAARAADECAAANKSVVLSEPHSKPARPQVTSPKRQLPSSDTAPSEIPKHGNRRPGNASSPARIESAPSARCAPLNGIRRHEDHAVEILVPGTHCDRGSPTQIRMSEDGFAQAVLQAIPDEELYLSEGRVGQIVGDRGARRFESLSGREGESAMRLLISRHCRLVQRSFDIRENVAETRVLTIRPDHAALVLAAAVRSPKLRQLRWFLRHPAFLGDALDLAKPGWNASHGAYYDEPAELEGLEPKTVTNESAQKAFHALTVDFPFANEASRQNFIGMLLTAILRPALPGNVPMHAVIASLERTGKTKLIEQVLGGIVLGRPMSAISIGWSPEEIEKRVASIALAGEGLVHLDNVRELDSPALASLLTASSIGVRQFGKLDLSLVANRLVLVASGNNIQAHSELSKRIVPITLQPLDATPELREDFVHPDLEEYVGRVRAQYLAIVVGMVRSWKDSGSKPGSRRLGGFERWARVVGGILEEHGFREWMANYQDWVDNADPFSAELKAFVGIWHERFETSTVSTTALLEEIVLPRQLFVAKCLRTDNTRAQVSALGRYVLRPSTDRPVGSFVIRKHGSGNTNTWQLEPVSHTARGEAAA